MNHYKARIAELEASRLKLMADAREAREENEKLKAQLNRAKSAAAKARALAKVVATAPA